MGCESAEVLAGVTPAFLLSGVLFLNPLFPGTPEKRKAAATPARTSADSHPIDKRRWPGRSRQGSSMTMSLDFTDQKTKLSGSGTTSVVRALQNLMTAETKVKHNKLEIPEIDGTVNKLVYDSDNSDHASSDTESISSGSSLGNEQSSYQEYMRLKERYDALKQLERNYYGEEIDSLTTNELESLERQLHCSLKQIRTIRTQSLMDKLYEQQKMEHQLYESNKTLRLRLEEESQVEALQWDAHATTNGMVYGHHPHQVSQTTRDAFYQPIGCKTTLQIGYQTEQMSAVTSTNMNHHMQGWPA
ncbi:hypothetical protein L1887_20120 [Cichorium endivia]|nr:hypothetical protein L1887_20120 [Cichorium endivia]